MVELARHPDVLHKGDPLVLSFFFLLHHVPPLMPSLVSHFWNVVQQELDLAFPDPSDICDEQKFMKVSHACSYYTLFF